MLHTEKQKIRWWQHYVDSHPTHRQNKSSAYKAQRYRGEILRSHVLPIYQNVNAINDNDRPHTSRQHTHRLTTSGYYLEQNERMTSVNKKKSKFMDKSRQWTTKRKKKKNKKLTQTEKIRFSGRVWFSWSTYGLRRKLCLKWYVG